ncbi:integral membrane family protein [Hirsutella rhossiliensis]|uniref:Integral membrane family protein n=1 Tax=Hirsutella rhossiliensis TaxID=111463 RepID=A0A9P8N5G1_9HYPO|nr:integral membrane family protein [Hirsutella rhossiliensis]KAH0964992.1 integral membrane family protein [Hirsutella rhossiliensis]
MGDMAAMAGWVTQDVDLNQDGVSALIITCAVLLPLTWIAVGLRTYTRAVLTRSFQIDDWFMLIAQVIFTATCAMIIEGTRRGLGKHNAAVTDPDDLVAALMWQAIATAVYVLNMVFIKLSIGVFLLRLAVWTAYKWILWISLVVFTLWGLGIFIWNIFQCTPVAKQWDFRIERGFCASPDAIIASAYALSVLTVLSDWLYALLPVPMVWNVKMTKQAKWTVVAILGLGIFASIATLIRLKFLNKLQDTGDLLYSAVDAMIWTIVEPGVAIFASSLATVRPLLRVFRIRGFTSGGRSSAGRTQNSEMSTARGYSNDNKMSTRHGTTFATAGVSDMSLDNIDDESDFRQPDVEADNTNVALESKGRPQRKRPKDMLGGDSISEILAMEDSIPSSIKDDEEANQSVDEASDSEAHDFGPHDLEAQTQNGLGVPSRR